MSDNEEQPREINIKITDAIDAKDYFNKLERASIRYDTEYKINLPKDPEQLKKLCELC